MRLYVLWGVLDEQGEPLIGHHPVRLEVRHARGTFEEWTGRHVTDAGVLELPMRPARYGQET